MTKRNLSVGFRRTGKSDTVVDISADRGATRPLSVARVVPPAFDNVPNVLAGVLSAFTDAAAIVSRAGDVLAANPAYDALVQAGEPALSWVTVEGEPAPPDHLPLALAARAEATETHLTMVDGAQSHHAFKVTVRPLTVQGWGGAAILVLRDLCDQQARRSADRFVELLGHELKAPVTSLRSHADLFVHYLASDVALPEARFAMERIHVLSSRLGLMIQDLYELARITSGKLQVKRSQINLHDVAVAAIDIAESLPGMPPIHVALVGDAPVRTGDAERLSGVILNLLNNAATHAHTTDGITVRIWTEPNGEAAIEVEDRGPGISPEEITRIFRRHYQVPVNRSEGESSGPHGETLGLGLFISQQIVRAHGGRIEVTSEVGVGSRFTIYLPRD